MKKLFKLLALVLITLAPAIMKQLFKLLIFVLITVSLSMLFISLALVIASKFNGLELTDRDYLVAFTAISAFAAIWVKLNDVINHSRWSKANLSIEIVQLSNQIREMQQEINELKTGVDTLNSKVEYPNESKSDQKSDYENGVIIMDTR